VSPPPLLFGARQRIPPACRRATASHPQELADPDPTPASTHVLLEQLRKSYKRLMNFRGVPEFLRGFAHIVEFLFLLGSE